MLPTDVEHKPVAPVVMLKRTETLPDLFPEEIVVAEATGQDTQPDPLFFFAGGPGQAATETWVMIRSTLSNSCQIADI